MPTALVLGASRGLGLEFVRQYRADGWRVVAAARSAEGVEALKALGAEAHQLDLTDAGAVAGLGWKLDGESFDVAIHNAGVIGPRTEGAQPIAQQDFDAVMHTNVLGPMMALPMLLPFVETGNHGRGGVLAVLSSRMGSIGGMDSNGAWMYRISKAAANAVLKSVSLDARHAICVALHPGWVQTDMGGPNADLTPQQSVAGMRRTLAGLTQNDNGSFHNYDGTAIPW
ncbi:MULTISPECIES: SDR family oxidoreductase [unclassified Cupriavidus]|uniref:SDR family oxidoreductase n=1 Tax=unclassified Cupriavidus TaxID=2640874 RepID=UPI001BFFF08D|nr:MULTISPECIES: SDR family oxidoreductase [unclassified Cupriavidus]MCA3190589.1 SDR family oxidoreductase [Cupriavidus sp.]MCA3197294.1 SDR family oxidoreductase [Cupriavidus sp.]MCA3202571.1 SDR family oxidoreductase [Cupriavidus sp.]MCA3231962.1 SDR family oxidoreductase [Cupriavidus sp.]QWE94574.1 SDR family oxidoreductase [Cupriavidus sp. EM10]